MHSIMTTDMGQAFVEWAVTLLALDYQPLTPTEVKVYQLIADADHVLEHTHLKAAAQYDFPMLKILYQDSFEIENVERDQGNVQLAAHINWYRSQWSTALDEITATLRRARKREKKLSGYVIQYGNEGLLLDTTEGWATERMELIAKGNAHVVLRRGKDDIAWFKDGKFTYVNGRAATEWKVDI